MNFARDASSGHHQMLKPPGNYSSTDRPCQCPSHSTVLTRPLKPLGRSMCGRFKSRMPPGAKASKFLYDRRRVSIVPFR